MDEDQDLFRDLCENANDLIQSVSPAGRLLYVNRAWLRTLGYRAEEVGELSLFDIIHPNSRKHCEQVMQELQVGRPVVRIEAEFVAKDGRTIAVEGSASCRFKGGQPSATVGIFRDVSENKKTRQQLDRLFDLSLDLLCVAGTDGYFKQINPAFEKVLGYSREELLSRSFLEFVHPQDRERTVREVQNLADGLSVVDFQNRYRAKDGSYCWLAWRSAPLPAEGLIYAVARDITEQKRNQELMARQAAELARSNADLEQFAYVASHDLRAPLRSIGNLAEWIEQDLPGELPAKVQQHIHKLRARIQRMEQLTEDLLTLSRAGRERGEIRRVDTAALVQDLIGLHEPPPGLKVTAAPNLPVFETAAAALEQVLRNLIGNAIKHHRRPDGKVVVAARDLGESFEFSVTDDGPGIPAQYQERIFQMFQKLESPERVDGTGIGLALVKRIVESQGGKVWVESQEGRGATFRFTWPRQTVGADAGDSDC